MDIVTAACNGSLSGVPGTNASFIHLINTLFVTQCSLFKTNNYPEDYGDQLKNGDEFDFIVVGAGSAGSVVASRLSENPDWNILLIEAGGNPMPIADIPQLWSSSLGTENDWNYTNERNGLCCLGMVDQRCSYSRGKVLGGTGSLNALLYVRGNRDDYDEWERLGNEGWGYDSVLEYFKKSERSDFNLINDETYDSLVKSGQDSRIGRKKFASERYHSNSGMLGVGHYGNDPTSMDINKNFFDAVEELGYSYVPDINGKSQMGFTEPQATVWHGKRADTAKMFLNPVRDRPNLFVVKHAIVQKILLEDKKATGVELIRKGDSKQVMVKKEVILSAGTIDSPKLLLLSGMGPREHLESLGIPVLHDLKGVGENLQEHPESYAFPILINEDAPTRTSQAQTLVSFYEYLTFGTGTFSTIGADIIGFVDTVSNSSIPDVEFYCSKFNSNDTVAIRRMFGVQRFGRDLLESYVDISRKGDILFVATYVLRPKSIGRLLLRSPDPKDPPILDTNFLKVQEDLDTLVRAANVLEKISKTAALQHLKPKLMELNVGNCSSYKFKTNEYWECAIRYATIGGYHPCCTNKMGPKSDPFAVVDNKLKVHGIENLRVIDASIMPAITRGNINAPTIMIGEKGSDLIKNDYS